MGRLCGHTITYRIAVEPPQGVCKPKDPFDDSAGKVTDFSSDPGVAASAMSAGSGRYI